MAFFKEKRASDRRERSDRRKKDRRTGAKGVFVADIVEDKNTNVSTVSLTATVAECAKVMTFMKVGVLVVLNDNRKLVGMVSERAIVEALGHDEIDLTSQSVADIMNTEVTACTPETELDIVLDTMKEQGVRHVPVLEHDQVTSIISIVDILKFYL